MVTLEKLRGDLLAARKARDEVAVGLLNPLVGEAAMIGKNAGNRETTPEETQRVIKKFLDGARETREILAKQPPAPGAGLTAEETPLRKLDREIRILEAYMPQQMTEAELREAITAFKGENPGAQMGQYMAHLKANYAGKYDGKQANQIVKSVLG